MSTATDADLAALHDRLRGLRYYAAVEGKRICEGISPLVLEHTTAAGRVLAVKVTSRGNIDKSEADMSMPHQITTFHCSSFHHAVQRRHLTSQFICPSAIRCKPWHSCAQGPRLVRNSHPQAYKACRRRHGQRQGARCASRRCLAGPWQGSAGEHQSAAPGPAPTDAELYPAIHRVCQSSTHAKCVRPPLHSLLRSIQQ